MTASQKYLKNDVYRRPSSAGARDTLPDQCRGDTLHDAPAPIPGDAWHGLTVIPVLLDGSPDLARRSVGGSLVMSAERVRVRFPGPDVNAASLLLALSGPDGLTRVGGIAVKGWQRLDDGLIEVDGEVGGLAGQILAPENLTSTLKTPDMQFGLPFPDAVYDRWVRAGVLTPVTVDRVQLCPKCHSLPTFRMGCANCGSARIATDQLIHHFPCAHVGVAEHFDSSDGLACPKCRTRDLVVGADFEYLSGPFRCQDCHWSDTALIPVGHCLRCSLRFPGEQAYEMELRGYHAHRLDLLAVRQTP